MQKWKKAMSALLMTGMLTTACAGMALADTTSGSAQERPAGQRGGGMFMEEDWLTEQIAGLSSEQQAEILALQAELKALQPKKEQREMPTLSTEQQAVMEEYQSQIKAKEEAITAAVFGSWADSPSTYTRRATNWARSLRWGGA